jgi:hypothetical protein
LRSSQLRSVPHSPHLLDSMDLPGLNPRPGRVVEAKIRRKFGTSITLASSNSCSFFLVVSFGRCRYRLSILSVSSILQAVIRGSTHDLHVVFLSDQVFRFSVSSLHVGFHIYKLKSFECEQFRLFFHLWNGGGPNYALEYRC